MVPSKETIEGEARSAAAQEKTLNEACPYPFGSEEGMHFTAVYLLAHPDFPAAVSLLDRETLLLFIKEVLREAQQ